MTTSPAWLKEGYSHIWHPYTQMHPSYALPLPVVSAEGVTLTLADGRTLIDGMSAWWTMCHGYHHPHLREAVHAQLDQLPHVMFAGLAHEQGYTLATRLSKLAPEGLNRVFFSDSGSVAIEVAMKMAVQYWRNQGDKNRNKFISFHNAYHGDTLGALSLTDPDRSMHQAFSYYAPKQYWWDLPSDEYSFTEFDDLLKDIKKTTAALVMEPIVQCAGGMKFHTADVLAEISRICKKHEVLLIVDEIATGFYRTGHRFACQEAGITPDILCIGKGLTGGMMSLGATLATDQVFEGFLSEEREKAFMHGPTYMANPLACAAANASLDLFEQHPYLEWVETIETEMWEGLQQCKASPLVADVRVKGAIGVVELKEDAPMDVHALRQHFLKEGAYIRPIGKVIYLMPAFTIKKEELEFLMQVVRKAVGIAK